MVRRKSEVQSLSMAPVKSTLSPDELGPWTFYLCIAQPGSALVWGTRGRRFEPCYKDQFQRRGSSSGRAAD
jgi:hypothetical protein